jgi:BlaI family penicillinase repressor
MKTPRISDHEWEVMKVLWSQSPCTAGQVIEELLRQDASWHPKTVKTFLTRLVNKQVLAFRKEGRAYVYFPLFSEKECVRAATESFLQRVFGGSLRPMLAHFIEEKKLSRREIQDLKKILEEGGGK